MRHLLIFLSFLFLSTSIFGQERLRKLENFTELRVSGDITVQLYNGEGISATVSVTTGEESDVKTDIENGILRVQWKKNVDTNNRRATVKLYYDKLEAIDANAGAVVTTTKLLKAENLKLSASSGSKLNLEINCATLEAKSNSGATISLKGETGTQNVDVNSGASYKAADLVTKITNIEASSGASAKVNVTGTISAESSTGASIKYTGNPSTKDIEENKYSGGNVSSF